MMRDMRSRYASLFLLLREIGAIVSHMLLRLPAYHAPHGTPSLPSYVAHDSSPALQSGKSVSA